MDKAITTIAAIILALGCAIVPADDASLAIFGAWFAVMMAAAAVLIIKTNKQNKEL